MCPKSKVPVKKITSDQADYVDEAAGALVDGRDPEAARLQAAIDQLGSYGAEIAQALTDMANTLGAAQEKTAETVAAASTTVNDLSQDVQRASTRLDVVAGARED